MRKIFTITFCLLFTLCQTKFSDAQIVYADIPDIEMKCTGNSCFKSCSLDLNNDGITDFSIGSQKFSNSGEDYSGNKYHYTSAGANIHYTISTGTKISVSSPYPTNWAAAHIIGSEIGSETNWQSNGISNGTVTYYESFVTLKSYYKLNGTQPIISGYWLITEDRYLGIKISSSGQTYYGWVRLSVSISQNQATVKIKDYAYQSTPNVTILAGDTGASSVARPTDKAMEEIKPVVGIEIYPNPVSSATQITFSLSKDSKISLNLYDITGRHVKIIAHKTFTKGNQQIKLNTKELNAGIYLVRLQSEEFAETKKIVVVK